MKKLKVLCLLLLIGSVAFAATRVLPKGTEIKVRTDTAVPAKPARGASYSATVSNDVTDSSGAVAIPRGARAKLVASAGPNSKDTILDLSALGQNPSRGERHAPNQ